jgi:phosphoenolpyruvate carboxylase
MDYKIPRCMSTQHPDNVTSPVFTTNGVLGPEDEVREAHFAFSHFGCDEQMWDIEAKEADASPVKKLYQSFPKWYKEHMLGRDVRLTLRVPNPTVEKDEAVILGEILLSISRAYSTAKRFYNGSGVAFPPPVTEIIVPMTSSVKDIERPYQYYRHLVALQHQRPDEKDITFGEWLGELKPESINVIPLFEDKESMLGSADMVRSYLADKTVPYQRVFLARSDPAMNYGMLSAVLLNKIALQRLDKLSKELSIPLCPIVGVGGAPFRGNLNPETVDGVIAEYPSAHTFTVQSAFKYDNHLEQVKEGISKLRQRVPSAPQPIDEARALDIIERYGAAYYEQIGRLEKIINRTAAFVPKRRMRKLHTGIWGLARQVGEHQFPRVISFTSALYSLGLPPEIFGLNALTKEDLKFVQETCPSFVNDLRDAAQYLNSPRGLVPKALEAKVRDVVGYIPEDNDSKRHKEITAEVAEAMKQNSPAGVEESIVQAADLRSFLG